MWLVNLEYIGKYLEEYIRYIEYMENIRKYLEEEPNGLAEDEDKNKSQQNKTSFWVGWRLPFWCKTGDHFRSLICVFHDWSDLILFCSEWLNITLSYNSNYASCLTIFQKYLSYLKYCDFDVCFKIFIPSPHKSVSGE